MRRRVLVGLGAVLSVAVVAAFLRQPEPDLLAPYRDKADRGYSGYSLYRKSSNDLVRHDFLSVAGSAEAMIADLSPKLIARGYQPDPLLNGQSSPEAQVQTKFESRLLSSTTRTSSA